MKSLNNCCSQVDAMAQHIVCANLVLVARWICYNAPSTTCHCSIAEHYVAGRMVNARVKSLPTAFCRGGAGEQAQLCVRQ